MQSPVFILFGAAAVMFLVIGGLSFLAHCYTLDGIKSLTVGDGQHGTARWVTKQEIKKPIPMCHSPPSSGDRRKTCPTSKGHHGEYRDEGQCHRAGGHRRRPLL